MHKQFNNSCNNHDHRNNHDINNFDNHRTHHNTFTHDTRARNNESTQHHKTKNHRRASSRHPPAGRDRSLVRSLNVKNPSQRPGNRNESCDTETGCFLGEVQGSRCEALLVRQ